VNSSHAISPLEKGDYGGFAVVVDTQSLKLSLDPSIGRLSKGSVQRTKWNAEIASQTNIANLNKLLIASLRDRIRPPIDSILQTETNK